MKLAIIGSGYVGLVTGACFSEMGNEVICVDKDADKIGKLQAGIIPIFEPGLEDLVNRNAAEGRLLFTTDLPEAVRRSQIIFIAVGTPPEEDGSADLQYVLSVARDIASAMNEHKIIVDKSTVPVGTADLVRSEIQKILNERGSDLTFDLVSNPEFLKEGAAVEDFMKPDRVVVGTENEAVAEIMRELYAPFNMSRDRVLVMSIRSAEMTKYAANAMLATKISFMNEIALLCEKLGADVAEVRNGIGSDSRIGYKFIYPGVGYGGSCFPKDVKALIHMAKQAGVEPQILTAVEQRNEEQKRLLVQKVQTRFGTDLSGKTFAVWGLAFKPQTDDMREAPSLVIIPALINAGAKVVAYDPVAVPEAERRLKNLPQLSFAANQYDALQNADALLLITEWHQFRHPDFDKIKALLKTPVIFDGRNQYDPVQLREQGFEYYGIGRG
ncbi:MAG TPA: UDP-glucose/GDP-mannose dehydrogenase family protein [Candidatus Cloacimonadota bacterium]|nr:UDP-glucose/GDP-mannose dehydrogenase family protein [Candidatus Cloacimonadota bacterium]HQL15585.1 UDP-glucose/GDP-mannose dehydrogenase family protein [Candidatus Cloacimonadota bacterium]